MSQAVRPIASFRSRLPSAGRIRTGVQTARAMRALDTFRFTSGNKELINLLAEKYGGEVAVWNPPRGKAEWEVITTSDVIDVVVPPMALGNTPIYECWSAAGLARRCDGVTMQTSSQSPDGAIQVEQPCLCEITKRMECKPITRLELLIPDIPFTGTWMLESKGWTAAHEMPGMVQMIINIQRAGYAKAELALEAETVVRNGQTRNFIVPRLRIPHTLLELADGMARLASLGPADNALGPGTPHALEPGSLDDEVVEAELLEDDPLTTTLATDTQRGEMLRIAETEMHLTSDDLMGFCFTVSKGRTDSWRDITEHEVVRLVAVFTKIVHGDLVYLGLDGRRAKVVDPKKVPDAESTD